MYGTIARIRPQPGKIAELQALNDEWNRHRRPKIQGVVGDYLFRPENRLDELIMVAIFADKASYVANAQDPEQDEWYQRFRALLEDDPVWEDGEFIETL